MGKQGSGIVMEKGWVKKGTFRTIERGVPLKGVPILKGRGEGEESTLNYFCYIWI